MKTIDSGRTEKSSGIVLGWIVIIHCLVFLLFWLTNPGFHPVVNGFLKDATGLHLSFVMSFIYFSSAIGLINFSLLIVKKTVHRFPLNSIVIPLDVLYTLFFYGSFFLVFLKNPVQINRLVQLVQYFRIIFDAGVLLVIALGIHRLISRKSRPWKKRMSIILLILFGIFPILRLPGAVLLEPLPEKPLLIAHRGASFLAPENTMGAMKKATQLGVYGLETDIVISRDGIPFLMHDSSLARTTNVAQIFPSRIEESAGDFTWNELAQLNAGQWFVEQDPFGSIATGQVSAEEIKLYQNEKIPSLRELLDFIQSDNIRLIYDLRASDGDRDYSGTPLDRFMAVVQASSVEAKIWFLADIEDIQKIQIKFPQAILAAGIDYNEAPTPEELVSAGYIVVNSEYGISNRMIHAYHNSGLWVNLWTVDEVWQFSRLWIQGVNSVTTNNILGMWGERQPLMVMTLPVYLSLWIMVWIISILVAYSGFLFTRVGRKPNATITRG